MSAGPSPGLRPVMGARRATDIATRKPLRIQPVLAYGIHGPEQYRDATSWRPWGGLFTERHLDEEKQRIRTELEQLKSSVDFPLELLPLEAVDNSAADRARALAESDHDGMLIYGQGGHTGLLDALAAPEKWNLMFVRHRTGPAYLWYEIAHPHFLRRASDEYQYPGGMTVNDIVVDDYDDVAWRLRALCGLKNMMGARIVAIGGAMGWGAGGQNAPALAREQWGLQIIEIPYDELGTRIEAAMADDALQSRAAEAASAYLASAGVTLYGRQDAMTTEELMRRQPGDVSETRGFVERAFVLTEVFRDLMHEHDATAITVGECMTTIIPMTQTTACMTLTVLNDEGYLAFCESDFVVIPSGMLLHGIAGKPVFLCNPTWPHHDVVTVAHCSAPRRMDGANEEPVKIRTHFESDYGAAPKVEMRAGQELTVIAPDFASERWLGFRGVIAENPYLDICTTQVDLTIDGDAAELVREMRGFHWMTCYDDYRKELGYALNKAGINWLDVTDARESRVT